MRGGEICRAGRSGCPRRSGAATSAPRALRLAPLPMAARCKHGHGIGRRRVSVDGRALDRQRRLCAPGTAVLEPVQLWGQQGQAYLTPGPSFAQVGRIGGHGTRRDGSVTALVALARRIDSVSGRMYVRKQESNPVRQIWCATDVWWKPGGPRGGETRSLGCVAWTASRSKQPC